MVTMDVFFDTSVVVAMLVEEPGSAAASRIWGRTTRAWAWNWLLVETDAALGRRRVPPRTWSEWRRLEGAFTWIEPGPGFAEEARAFNRAISLRAADAGHLLIFERLARGEPALRLATFDSEMRAAALALGYPMITDEEGTRS
jgi:predicted nucleic acid-binding protein